jgi:hypothetical protein
MRHCLGAIFSHAAILSLLTLVGVLCSSCADRSVAPAVNSDGSVNITVQWTATLTVVGAVFECNTSFSCGDLNATGGMRLVSATLATLSGNGQTAATCRVLTEGFVRNDWFQMTAATSLVAGPVVSVPSPSPLPLAFSASGDVITIFGNMTRRTGVGNVSSTLTVLLQCEGAPAPPPCASSRQGLTITTVWPPGAANIAVEDKATPAVANTALRYNHAVASQWVAVANISINSLVYSSGTTFVLVTGTSENCSVTTVTPFLFGLLVRDGRSAEAATAALCAFRFIAPALPSAPRLCGLLNVSDFVSTIVLLPDVAVAIRGDGSTPAALRDFATSTSIISGLSGNPNAAAKSSSIGTLRRLIVCQELNEPSNSLTGLKIGTRDFDSLRGAVVGNIALVVVVFFAVFLVCDVVAAAASYPFLSSLMTMVELLHLPSITYPLVVAVLQPTIGSAMTLVVNSKDPSDRALGLIAALLCILYCVYVFVVLRRAGDGRLAVVPVVPDESYRRAALDHPGLFRFFVPTHHYAVQRFGLRTAIFKRHFLFLFHDYRYRYYSYVNDLLAATLLGIVAATAVTEKSICEFQIACVFSVAFGQFVAACVMSPCMTLFDGVYLHTSNTLSLVLSAVMFVNSVASDSRDDDSSPLNKAEDFLTYAMAFPSSVKALVDIISIFLAFPRIFRKARLLFERRATGADNHDMDDNVMLVSLLPPPTAVPAFPAAADAVPAALAPAAAVAAVEVEGSAASSERIAPARDRAATRVIQDAPVAPAIGARGSIDDLMDLLLQDDAAADEESTTPKVSDKSRRPTLTYASLGATEMAVDSILMQHKIRRRSPESSETAEPQPGEFDL